MPTSKFAAFDPLMIGALRQAFDEACAMLAEQPPSDATRELLAVKITDLAQSGLLDPSRLRDEAVAFYKSRLT